MLVKTPIDPPSNTSDRVTIAASLAADGTLTAHFDYEFTGDEALGMRSGFRQLAPAQWPALAQQVSYSLNYAGDVAAVNVKNLEDPEKPFHLSYDYTRKNYSGWDEHRIVPPLPPLGFGPGDEADKPTQPFWAGAPGVFTYRVSLQLPKGFSAELPHSTALSNAFAEYSAHYSEQNGVLITERKMTIKAAKVREAQWQDYQKFSKAIRTDQTSVISLSETSAKGPTVPDNNPEAAKLIARAGDAWRAQDMNAVRDLLGQAERLNSKQAGLWAAYGALEIATGHVKEAIADCRKELEFHPEEISAYQELSAILDRSVSRDEAIEVWRGVLAARPENEIAAARMAQLLIAAKRYEEIAAMLEKPIAAAPDKYSLRSLRVEALLNTGQKDQGIAESKKIASETSEWSVLNDLAFSLAEADAGLGLAQDMAEKAVSQLEHDCADFDLGRLAPKDLAAVTQLAAAWDTLGWVYFKQSDTTRAEKYLDAAWGVSQSSEVADHLGQVYEKEGRHRAAVHIWRLALASNGKDEYAPAQLRKAGAPLYEPVGAVKGGAKAAPISAGEELGRLRTIKVAGLPKQTGSAEFFVLLSKQQIEDVQFISGVDALKSAGQAIRATQYSFPFPDAGPERLIRRGILSCSAYTTPSCSLTLLLPSTTTVARIPEQQTAGGAKPSSEIR